MFENVMKNKIQKCDQTILKIYKYQFPSYFKYNNVRVELQEKRNILHTFLEEFLLNSLISLCTADGSPKVLQQTLLIVKLVLPG